MDVYASATRIKNFLVSIPFVGLINYTFNLLNVERVLMLIYFFLPLIVSKPELILRLNEVTSFA